MFLRNKRFIAATLTFIIAAMSLSALPIAAAADTSKYVFYDDFEAVPETEYFVVDSALPGRFPVITRESGKLKITRSTAMDTGGTNGASTNWAQFILPASKISAAEVTDTDKFIIEWDMEISTKYPTSQIAVNGSASVGLYNTSGAKNGKYYAVYDRKEKTVSFYAPDSTEALTATKVPATTDGSFDVKFIMIAAAANSYNTIDNLKIYPYYGMDAELAYKNEGGAEPNSVNVLLSDEFIQTDDLTPYVTVDGQAVADVSQSSEDPLLYTVTFADTLDFNSEHTLNITDAPALMYQKFSKELPFKVRDRGLFANLSLKSGAFSAGAQKIVADIANETDLTDDISLIAAVYSADGRMKAFDEFTLSSATDVTEFDFTVPTIETGDTMEIFAASSLSSLDIIGTKTIYTEEGVSYEKASAVEAVSSTATPVCNSTDLYEEITITLPEGASDRYVSLVVLTSGDTLAKSNVYYLATKKSENGVAEFDIKMADASATHSYIWHSQGEEANTGKSFNFYPKSFMDEGLVKINGAKDSEMKGYMNTYAEALGIVVPEESDSALDYAYYAFAALRDEAYPEDGFERADIAAETFDTALFIARKGSGETGKFIEEFNTKYAFDEKVYSVYSTVISSGAKGAVHSSIEKGKAYNIEAVKTLFNQSVVLDGNKNAENYSQTKKIIEELYEIIGLDMTEYNKLSASKKSVAAQALTQKAYDDFDEFADAFDDACDAAAKGGSGSGGGLGFGGGGGGGKTNSSAATTGGVFSDEIAPDNTNAKKYTSFDDMDGYEWAIDAVEDFFDRGIINGKSEKFFAPADNVTRAEIAKILALALELEESEEDEAKLFGDVASNHWAYEYIMLMSGKGLINGVEDGVFGVDMPLTRQMLITLLYRAAGEPTVTSVDDFADMNDADDYAKNAMRYYKSVGAVEGVGNNRFMPQEPITRAETVVMVSKCLAVK